MQRGILSGGASQSDKNVGLPEHVIKAGVDTFEDYVSSSPYVPGYDINCLGGVHELVALIYTAMSVSGGLEAHPATGGSDIDIQQ